MKEKMNIAVLGAGTYGSYVINSLLKKNPEANITLFDVGDKSVKSEKETGALAGDRQGSGRTVRAQPDTGSPAADDICRSAGCGI